MENEGRRISSFSGSVVRQGEKSTLVSTPPTWSKSTYAYNSQWLNLLKRISLLLKKRDRMVLKQSMCECKTSSPLLFEFSLVCTPCDKGVDNVQRVLNNWYMDYGYDDRDLSVRVEIIPTPPLDHVQWQIYDHCEGGNVILEKHLKIRGGLIKMLLEEDEDAIQDRFQLKLLLRPSLDENNFHTFDDINGDIVLNSPLLFCYRGLCKNCTCVPFSSRLTFVKRDATMPRNSLVLSQWPFSHDRQDQLVEGGICEAVDVSSSEYGCSSCADVRSFVYQSCLVQRVSLPPI